MNTVNEYEGKLVVEQQSRVAIISSRFNGLLVDSLESGAIDTLTRHGLQQDNIDVVRVPGAFEIPLTAKKILAKPEYDAVIALGIVIRGATAHFDYVASSCASGCQTVSLETGKPVIFGVLTTETIEQAIERSGTKAGNKGVETALALIEMLSLTQSLEKHHGE